MTPTRLCLRNLAYHWRGNLAVFLGVVVGSTVLTGALLVGDSLRGSLRDLAQARLGWVEQVLVAPRFFRQALAEELASGSDRVCPIILLQGTAEAGKARAGGVTILGIDDRFWGNDKGPFSDASTAAFAWLNTTLAQDLGARDGTTVTLHLQKPSLVPRETLLAHRDDRAVVDDWQLPVRRVLMPTDFGDRFSLRPEVRAPRIAFVPLGALQARLSQADRCNAVLAAGNAADLNSRLREHLDLPDWGLKLVGPAARARELFDKLHGKKGQPLKRSQWRGRMAESVVKAVNPEGKDTISLADLSEYFDRAHPYVSLESTNLFLEPYLASKALKAVDGLDLRAAPTLVYLANSIAVGGESIPYSVVAALDPAAAPPLGPFLPRGVRTLGDDEIMLTDWKESPLPRKPGEKVTLGYFPPEHHGDVQERTATFRLAGFVPMTGAAADPDLTPEFPGITDKLSITEWRPPFPYDNSRIKPRDEQYWREYRTTPKAYVTLRKGQELWGSRFGSITSIRLGRTNKSSDLDTEEAAYRRRLRETLSPEAGGFVFNSVKADALQAAGGATDFGQLFLGFSFFLISAALLLVGLLFRLNLDRRAAELGTLTAMGYRRRTMRRLLLGEGAIVAGVGTVVGAAVGAIYAGLLLQLLEALWPGGALRSFLRPHLGAVSLAIGAGGGFLVSLLTIAWAVRALGKVPPRALLAGQTTGETDIVARPRRRTVWWVAGLALCGAIALLAVSGSVHDHEMRAMTFFGSGSLVLTACLCALAGWMRSSRTASVEGHGVWAIARLGMRNAARHPLRSMLTAGLLAAAAFLLVAVEAFRKNAVGDAAHAAGGYTLIAESDLPLFLDLNTADGRRQVLDKMVPIYREALHGDNAAAEARVRQAADMLDQTEVVAFRVHAGDDVSCLNLYRPTRPRVLGVPDALINKDGFAFAATEAQDNAQRANPWLILRREGPEVPAFGEKNTVQWMLKSDLGGTVLIAPDADVHIAGLLQDSVFQSSVLISERRFLELFPAQEGYSTFLIRAPAGKQEQVKQLLETALADRGFEATPVAQRLEGYLAVENTYLSTFQALGGLGMILGALGLAVVLLRGVWERRGELALLRALGYRRRALGWLVLAENAFLLVVGLAAGTSSALAAVAPHLAGGAPWAALAILLTVVLAVGLVSGAAATAAALRAPLVLALRRE